MVVDLQEKQLRLLDIHDMMEAVDNFVCKSESKEAIVDATQKQMKKIEIDVQKSYKASTLPSCLLKD